MAKPKPVLREISGLSAAAAAGAWIEDRALPSHILRSEGFAAAGLEGLYQLFDEMEEKDGHLFAVLQTRKYGVLSCPRRVLPAGDAPRDRAVAEEVARILDAVPEFERVLLAVLDALGKGLSVQEIVWRVRPDGRVVPAAVKSRAPGRFTFDAEGALRLRTFERRDGAGEPLPPRKFVRATFGGLYENPWGRGLCLRAYWYYWFKKNNLKFWVVYNEKFGAPTVVGKYAPGASEEDRDRLFEVVQSMQNDTGVTVPDSIALELLEARRAGNASTYRELADWCNDEISKIVLGATLTAGEGRRSGSLALGEVHERVRGEYVEADARMLENVVNQQLVRWIVDFNWGAETPAPRWRIDTTQKDDLQREIAVDRQLLDAGVPIPVDYFHRKYQRPAPAGGEPSLRFDDRNLFQYHLRYGVLTVNEARERLGLPPVAWGDAPPAVDPAAPSAPAPDAAPGGEAERAEEREEEERRPETDAR